MSLGNLFLIFLGGGLGSMLRYALQQIVSTQSFFPLATFITNILASLLIGLLSAYLLIKGEEQLWIKYFLAVGFCGGFSTFSTFALELFNLNRQHSYGAAILYALLSVILSLSAVMFGFFVVNKFLTK